MPDIKAASEQSTTAFMQTPEFKAAVQMAALEAAKQAKTEVLKELALAGKSGDAAGVADSPDLENLFRRMAMSIAEISDQGTDRKRIAPEILTAREDARKKMFELIRSAFEKAEECRREKKSADDFVPVYKLKNKVYLDEILIDPIWRASDGTIRAQEIDWPGVPNEAMEPVNEIAVEIFQAFSDSIGSYEKVSAAQLVVTPRGLVVHGHPTRGMQAINASEPSEGSVGGVRIRGRGAVSGQVVEKNVLGTIAAPARQTA